MLGSILWVYFLGAADFGSGFVVTRWLSRGWSLRWGSTLGATVFGSGFVLTRWGSRGWGVEANDGEGGGASNKTKNNCKIALNTVWKHMFWVNIY